MILRKNNLANSICKLVAIISIIAFSIFISPAKASTNRFKTALIDTTSLKAFEGIYQSKDNNYQTYKITTVGDKLIAKNMDGDQQFTLTRKSEFGFEMPDDDGDETLPVIFSKNAAGEISQVTVAGRQIWVKIKNYVPVKEVALTATQLKAFEGKYEFEQKKGTFLQISATPTGLTLKQLWDGREVNFVAIGDDTFLNKQAGFPLKFTKDINGKTVKVLAFNRDMWDKIKE